MSRRSNESDWFYGANASFPKAVEWHHWFKYWQSRYDASQPFDRWLVDATMKVQQTYIKLAQRVRKNDGWTRQYTEDEMKGILDIVGEADQWFKSTRPREDRLNDLDPRLRFLCQALAGAFTCAVALGQELDQINRRGYLLVNTGEEARELAVGH